MSNICMGISICNVDFCEISIMNANGSEITEFLITSIRKTKADSN
jgi:hypothetical protein